MVLGFILIGLQIEVLRGSVMSIMYGRYIWSLLCDTNFIPNSHRSLYFIINHKMLVMMSVIANSVYVINGILVVVFLFIPKLCRHAIHNLT